MNGGNNLVENLAKSLVNELNESKTLNLMNDKKFSEFTYLLYEILDNSDNSKSWQEDESKKIDNIIEFKDDIQKFIVSINEYFNTNNSKTISLNSLLLKTSKILEILEDMQSGNGNENGNNENGKDTKRVGLKPHKDNNEKKIARKEARERKENDKKTHRLLNNLNKDIKDANKRNDKNSEKTLRGLKKIDKKVGTSIYKIFNKFKRFLFVGLALLFAKPIWEAIKKIINPIWEVLQPKIDTWFNELKNEIAEGFDYARNVLTNWFEKTFPQLNNWIKKEFPNVKEWFNKNWEGIKEWFTITFPQIKEAIDGIIDSTPIRWAKKRAINKNYKKIKKDVDEYEDLFVDSGIPHTLENDKQNLQNRIELENLKIRYNELDGNKTFWEKIGLGDFVTYQYKDENDKTRYKMGKEGYQLWKDSNERLYEKNKNDYQEQLDKFNAPNFDLSSSTNAPQTSSSLNGGTTIINQTTNNNTTNVIVQGGDSSSIAN